MVTPSWHSGSRRSQPLAPLAIFFLSVSAQIDQIFSNLPTWKTQSHLYVRYFTMTANQRYGELKIQTLSRITWLHLPLPYLRNEQWVPKISLGVTKWIEERHTLENAAQKCSETSIQLLWLLGSEIISALSKRICLEIITARQEGKTKSGKEMNGKQSSGFRSWWSQCSVKSQQDK